MNKPASRTKLRTVPPRPDHPPLGPRTSETTDRPPAAPSAVAPTGSNRRPGATSPAAASPAGSRGGPSPNRAPRSPRSTPPAPPRPAAGSPSADDCPAPSPQGPHTRKTTPTVCPTPASAFLSTTQESTESCRVRQRHGQPARGSQNPHPGFLSPALESRHRPGGGHD